MPTSPSRCALALLLVITASLALSGCSLDKLFKTDAAACIGDANCPNNQVCCSGICSKSCGNANTSVVSAALATDYVPGYEFDEIHIDLDGVTRTVNVNAVTDLVSPRSVSQFTEVLAGDHSMTVSLTLSGARVATRIVTFQSTGDVTVPFTLTRDCSGVTCGSAVADQCLGGTCVPRSCSELNQEGCPAPKCALDADCIATSACSVGVCIGGLCMQRRQDSLCAADQRCLPNIGCALQHDECDLEIECNDLAACTQERCVDHRCTSTRDDTRCGTTVCDPAAKEADAATGCTPAPCSADNCLPGPCETASCVGGQCQHVKVCQDAEKCCDGVCAVNCSDPRACAGRPAGYVCRVSVGSCDPPEACDGVSDQCPPDVLKSNGVVCRPVAGGCDVAESCDGVSGQCPPNALTGAGTVCRAKTDICDVAEACTGESSACPVDVFVDGSTVCRNVVGVCDSAELCTGSTAACPADGFQASTVTCRGSAGVCDVAELCTGSSADCPADGRVAAGTVCNPSAGPCDPAEVCNGGVACPANVYAGTNIVCRASVQASCDPQEVCPGNSPACPADVRAAQGTVCSDQGTCLYYACDASGGCTQRTPRNAGALCADGGTCAYTACDSNGGCSVLTARNAEAPCGSYCGLCRDAACIWENCEEYFGGLYCGVYGIGSNGCIR